MSEPAELRASTRFCAVFGHPVRHSASPAMHNPALAALGLDWRYLACDVHPDRLREAIAGAQAMKFIGLNLTIPHKLLAVDIVDELDVSAKTWGAVNTVRFEAKDASGAWQPLAMVNPDDIGEIRSHGFNTDADAITRSLREDLGFEPRGASVLLLGAGGAGRTAALKLASEGVGSLWLVNRTVSKAEEVAAEIRTRFPSVRAQAGWPVYDMIYRPAETPLLCAAKAAGCKVANGLGMLLYQGTKALEIWTGQPAPVELMRAALLKNVYARA